MAGEVSLQELVASGMHLNYVGCRQRRSRAARRTPANALGSRCCEVRVTTVRNRHIDAPDRTEEPTACGHLKGTDERAFLAKDEYRCRARFDEQGRIHDTAVDEDFVSRVVRESHRQRRRGSERCVDAGEGHEQSDEHSSRTCEARPAMR